MKVWREIFLEFALRAMRKAHYDFGIWELGQRDLMLQDFYNLNQGNGINFAPEETVRDIISQEILLSGIWKRHKIEKKYRSYWIDREIKIDYNIANIENKELYTQYLKSPESTNKYFKIDLLFQRVQTKVPVLIEAKRFELLKIDLKSKKVKKGKPQFKGISNDIIKLKLLKEVYKGKKIKINDTFFTDFRTYILVWGVAPINFNVKTNFIQKLSQRQYLSKSEMAFKYLPISWTDKMKVTKKLWVGLIEVE